MSRLNNKAWKILREEIKKTTQNASVSFSVQRDNVLRRLEILRQQSGIPATLEELRQSVVDIFPNFNEKVLKKAAKANQPNALGRIGVTVGVVGVGAVSLAGLIWVVNLPYPMIRRPVAKVAPMLLLPSYISMDRNYKDAISNVEQAQQLIDRSTSRADIDLGGNKVELAKQNLDALPVWFLGYEPVFYCSFFSCSWKFTFDEFQAARSSVGRMEAKVFQEKNALTQLEKAEANLKTAKQQYQQTTNPVTRGEALVSWQSNLDQLNQLPPDTLARKMAETKLKAYQRDFDQVGGVLSTSSRTGILITTAKNYALQATKICANPPHPVYQWEQCIKLWQDAGEQLKQVPLEHPGYVEAQQLLAAYKSNVAEIEIRLKTEADSANALEQAKNRIEKLLATVPTGLQPEQRGLILSEVQGIIYQLEKVKPGSTGYKQAQELLQSAENKVKQLQQ